MGFQFMKRKRVRGVSAQIQNGAKVHLPDIRHDLGHLNKEIILTQTMYCAVLGGLAYEKLRWSAIVT